MRKLLGRFNRRAGGTLTLGFVLTLAPPLAAQTRQASWSLAASAALAGFRGAAMDTTAGNVAVRPSQGIAFGVGLARRWSTWGVSLEISHLPVHVEAVSPEVVVQDRAEDFDRTRLAAMVTRRVARPGAGALELRLGPTVDGWSLGGKEVRGAIGGQAQLAIDFPVGPVKLEQVFGVGWSSSPFRTAELPENYRRSALRTMTVGIGVQFVL
jgi:hypothetical protein